MNFILFNGPPRSGKDTAAAMAFEYLDHIPEHIIPVWEKFSFPNKRGLAGVMNVECSREGITPYEKTKEEIIPELGVSYRQFQIDISEKFMKRLYGEDVFGRLLLSRCTDYAAGPLTPIFIVSDCGFQVEVDYLAKHNVLLLQTNRDGTSFKDDSRSPVAPEPGWSFGHVPNNGTLNELRHWVDLYVGQWLKEKVHA